eukprot:4076360-Amphidinium_carterae.2
MTLCLDVTYSFDIRRSDSESLSDRRHQPGRSGIDARGLLCCEDGSTVFLQSLGAAWMGARDMSGEELIVKDHSNSRERFAP